MEVYFDILDSKNVVELCRLRTANNKLPIEIGRWNWPGGFRVEYFF
jgi:hypothetical protein